MLDVICVGTATVDVFAKTRYSELLKIMEPSGEKDLLAYPTGSKILVDEVHFTTGGGGTNVAAALATFGSKVAFLGCIGKDSNADFVLKELKKYMIDTSLVVKKQGKTGFSIILDSIEHDRTILTFRGLNNNLDFKDIKKTKLKCKWFYFSAMLERSFETLEELAKFAERNGIKIAFNISSYLAEKGSVHLSKLLSRTELLVLNKEEAQLLVGKDTIENTCQKLQGLGPNIVTVTDGKKGAYCLIDNNFYFASTSNIKVVETTGAGDAFASTLLYGLMNERTVEGALSLATTNAESVISHHGAKEKLLTLKGAKQIIRKRPIKIKKKKI